MSFGYWFEKAYPLGFAVLAGWLLPASTYAGLADNTALLASGMTVAAVLIGFLATIASILSAMEGPAIRFMKKAQKYSLMIGYLWGGVKVSFWFLAVSLVLQFLAPSTIDLTLYGHLPWRLWVVLGAWTLLASYRAMTSAMTLMKAAQGDS